MRDRVYGVETLYHDPYYQRHIVGMPRVRAERDADGTPARIEAEANYAVFRTKLDGDSTVFNTGVYHDCIVRAPRACACARGRACTTARWWPTR
jgi:salicylate 5-hydroxylase small subunit